MKNLLKITLGILTSIGGFLDAGSIATTAAAGAHFGTTLLWAIGLSTLCIIFLMEMSGRLAVESKHTLADAMREHFGFRFQVIPLTAEMIVDFLIIAVEIGGVCIALQLITGIAFRWWALPVGFAVWLVLWIGSFGRIEKVTAFLGLITVCFVVAAFKVHPDLHQVAAGLLPRLPTHDGAQYWFLSVSITGSIITPYMFYFYSAGAVEEKWDQSDLGANRGVAVVGMLFGCLIAMAIMIVAARTLQPAGIAVDRYEQAPLMLVSALGRWGIPLFAGSLAIACFGAAIEVSLNISYVAAQSFGWEWGEDQEPRHDARFASTYTVFILAASLLMMSGIDPLKLTMFSMALAVVVLPVVLLPLLVIMNDEKYLKEHTNGWISNTVGVVTLIAAVVMCVCAIPLEIAGG